VKVSNKTYYNLGGFGKVVAGLVLDCVESIGLCREMMNTVLFFCLLDFVLQAEQQQL